MVVIVVSTSKNVTYVPKKASITQRILFDYPNKNVTYMLKKGIKVLKKTKYMTQQEFKIHKKTKVIYIKGKKRKILFPYVIKKKGYLFLTNI